MATAALFGDESSLMKDDNDRSRSRSPKYNSPSRSPREWKRPERRDRDRGRDRDRRGGGGGGGGGGRGDKIRLHLSNLPYELRWQELKDIIREKTGEDISYVELIINADGKASGSGIVEVKGRDVAEKCISILHRMDLKGRQMIVKEDRDDRPHGGAGGGGGGRQNTRWDRNDSSSSSGIASLMGGGVGGGGGSGIMSLMSGANSLNSGGGAGGGSFSLNHLSQLGIDIANITNQVFVANLDYKVTHSKMEEVFKIAGNVIEVELKTDKDGKSRGMATVRFEHPMEAVQAICLFNGQFLYDRQIGVRMDRWVDPILQDIPKRLPTGLKGLGVGLGTNGLPVSNIGQIANTLTLSMLTGQLNPTGNLGLMGNNMASSGLNLSALNVPSLSNNLLSSMNTGLSGLSSVNNNNNISNILNGLNSLNNLGSGAGLSGLNSNILSGLSGMSASSIASLIGGGGASLGALSSLAAGGISSGLGGGLGSLGGGGGMNSDAYLSSVNRITNLMGNSSGVSLGGGGGMGDLRGGGGSSNSVGGGIMSLGALGGGGFDSSSGGFVSGAGNGGVSGVFGAVDRDSRGGDRHDSYGGSMGGNSGMGRGSDGDSGSKENCSVFVKNLPYSYTWQILVEKFRDCGEIKYAEIKTENGRSRGCGVVQFYSPESARRAINQMNGARFEGRQLEVRIDRLAQT